MLLGKRDRREFVGALHLITAKEENLAFFASWRFNLPPLQMITLNGGTTGSVDSVKSMIQWFK